MKQTHSSLLPITGTVAGYYETSDSDMASGLMKVLQGDFRKRASVREEEAQHFKISDTAGKALDLSDLLKVVLKNDNV